MLFTSAKVVFIGISFFVRSIMQTIQLIFTKLSGKVAHGPWKKSFGGNLDHGST